MRNHLVIFVVVMSIVTSSCDNKPQVPNGETMTSGTMTVMCDDAAALVIEPQIAEFVRKHPGARVDVKVVSSREAMESLLARKTRLAIMSRGYLPDEDSLMKAFKVKPHKNFHIATDALVFYASKAFGSDTLSVEALREFFADATPLSKRVRGIPAISLMYVPGPMSSITANCVLQCAGGRALAKNAMIRYVGTSDSVKQSVAGSANAIGAGMLSDVIRDTARFKILGIKYTDADSNRRSMTVEQSAVYREMYPYPVKIQAMLLENLQNLPMGVASFLAYEPGPQKYFLQHGIVPAYARIQLYEE